MIFLDKYILKNHSTMNTDLFEYNCELEADNEILPENWDGISSILSCDDSYLSADLFHSEPESDFEEEDHVYNNYTYFSVCDISCSDNFNCHNCILCGGTYYYGLGYEIPVLRTPRCESCDKRFFELKKELVSAVKRYTERQSAKEICNLILSKKGFSGQCIGDTVILFLNK